MATKKKTTAKTSTAAPTHFKVVSPWVRSAHKKGDVITRAQAQTGGADVDNLLYIGAIEPTDAPGAASSTSTNTNTGTQPSTGTGSGSTGSTGSGSAPSTGSGTSTGSAGGSGSGSGSTGGGTGTGA